ncbi:RHS repeat-associated core domain-containing protein [Pseudomonas sp. Irchel 3A7]|uniref:RHS repeat-associated core domain-containing protein n=1 Tax=Pseudomonas sp. Irchel 3A7 TaxID=2008913 RepID=UPI000BA4008F|nr:RHS repeat-associated core domain-containing protein [Pseudomonas sp. Irchel 3A7]
MRKNREPPLCRYRYDALDRLAVCTPAEQASTGRYYQKNRLATEIQGLVQHSIFQYDDQLLAQHQHQGGTVATTLLITDQQRSVLNALDATPPRSVAYTPYGHRPMGNGLLSLLGFNGEQPDLVTGHYHLGNGYRQFNPVLMRFNSPDSWSPFGKGGFNVYAYCAGNPINRRDPTGHALLKPVMRLFKQKGFDDTDFMDALPSMKKTLGGNKAIRKAAVAAGTTPEKYLINKAVNAYVDESYKFLNMHDDFLKQSDTLSSVIDDIFRAAIRIDEYKRVSYRLFGLDGQLNAETIDKVLMWNGEFFSWKNAAKQMANDRIMALPGIQSAPPPPYTRFPPSSPPQPSDVGNNIRQP